MKRALLASLLALGIPALAVAGDEADQGYYSSSSSSEYYEHGYWDRWYVTPYIGAFIPDHKRGLVDDDYLYGFAIGKELGPFLNLELNANATRLNNRPGFGPFGRVSAFGPFGPVGGGHIGIYDVALDALGILNRGGVIAPYGVLGVGLIRDVYSSPGGDATHVAPELGIGAYINLWENNDGTQGFSLRPEIKARWDNPGGGIQYFNHDFVDYIAELGFQFSFGGTAPERHPATYEAPPAPPPVVQAPPPPPAPAPAPAPSVLPAHGSVTLTGVTFAHNKATLTTTSHELLDEMARGLRENPGLKIEIQGHTDSTGAAAYNEQLSQRRADAVREYLIEHGVSPSQVVARGYGESEPVASNATAAGRAANRRVVAKVLSNPNDVAIKGEGETHLATPAVPR